MLKLVLNANFSLVVHFGHKTNLNLIESKINQHQSTQNADINISLDEVLLKIGENNYFPAQEA